MTPWGPHDRAGLTAAAGGVTAAGGFAAGATTAGLRGSGKPDLAVVVGEGVCGAAAVTTTNQVKAAPCLVTEEHVRNGRARAVVVNAGNANACTGERGLADARRTAGEAGGLLGCDATDILVASTGIIGVPLPVERLIAGLPGAIADANGDGSERAATAICTTDTVTKSSAYELADESGRCRVGGIAKGAGMIEPAMATMLAILTTDAPLNGTVLRPMLRQAVARTFNRISVDACGSTNDTVILLASGRASSPPSVETFQRGLEAVCADLARAIVADAEGGSRVGVVTVAGAADEASAERLARAICSSALFRAALHGGDPNWGRILAAMGACDVPFEPERVTVTCGGITVCRFGTAASFDPGQAAAALSKPEVPVVVDLGSGRASATMLVADLSREYVTVNADYTT